MSAGFVVLDTDVASLSIKRRLPPSLLAQLVENDICITFVTLGELTKWVEMRRWGARTATQSAAVVPPGGTAPPSAD